MQTKKQNQTNNISFVSIQQNHLENYSHQGIKS